MRGRLSSEKGKNSINREFIKRFIEVCGSAEPAVIQRSFNISYQAAKNYLEGRLPDTRVLLEISKRTPYSIHWLLTGRGNKFAAEAAPQNTAVFTDQIREMIREECALAVARLIGHDAAPKVVRLQAENVRSETVSEQNVLDRESVRR